MKLLSATALLAFSTGCVLLALALAYPQQAIAECGDNDSAPGCVNVLPRNDIDTLATTAATQQHAANFAAKTGTPSADSAATASTVAPLGLFGSALVIVGYSRRKRSVHRRLG